MANKHIVTVQQMKVLEAAANEAGYSFAEMMQSAGSGVANFIDSNFRQSKPGKNTCFALIGPGNNGGDALVALTELAKLGWNVSGVLSSSRQDDPLLEAVSLAGINLMSIADLKLDRSKLENFSVIVDGLLGTGVKFPMREGMQHLFQFVAESNTTGIMVSIDCPSGIDCDTAEAAPYAIHAGHTLAIEAVKSGLLAFPAWSHVGKLHVIPLGFSKTINAMVERAPSILDVELAAHLLPKRAEDGHKGSFGRALIVGGSVQYPGAPSLAAEAALRSGTGLVECATIPSVQGAIAPNIREAIWCVLPEREGCISVNAAGLILEQGAKADACLIGPGLGDTSSVQDFIAALLAGSTKPHGVGFVASNNGNRISSLPEKTVIDADALRHLSKIKDWESKLPRDTVLTPHPGEFAALTGQTIAEVQADRINNATNLAQKSGTTVVLKGAFTVVAGKGGETWVLPVATSALAKGGSGDVLAGLICGLMAQGLSGFDAARLGVFIHGSSGLQAAKKAGQPYTVTAGDLIGWFPKIFAKLNEQAG